jgi:hypothetical protein
MVNYGGNARPLSPSIGLSPKNESYVCMGIQGKGGDWPGLAYANSCEQPRPMGWL